MKITPSNEYKKPLYAIGLTTAIMAIALTGCTDPKGKRPGVDYAGDVAIEVTENTEYSKPDGDAPVALGGDVEIIDIDIEPTE